MAPLGSNAIILCCAPCMVSLWIEQGIFSDFILVTNTLISILVILPILTMHQEYHSVSYHIFCSLSGIID